MAPARLYAAVAIRKAWADLLHRLGLRRLAEDAYDEALVRAFACSLEFEPAEVVTRPVGFACEHMRVTGVLGSVPCWHGCVMEPIYTENRAG